MSNLIVWFEIGFMIGIVLFVICHRKGLIQKWSRRGRRNISAVTPLKHNAG